MSELLKKSILNASCEDRLIIGLVNSIDHLYCCDPIKILAVVLTDSSDDMVSQAILETYCYEEKIPFLKTDSKLLKRILKYTRNFNEARNEPTCVLIKVSFVLSRFCCIQYNFKNFKNFFDWV